MSKQKKWQTITLNWIQLQLYLSELKNTLSSTVKTVVSTPAAAVKDLAVCVGFDGDKIDTLWEGISDMWNKVQNGEGMTTKPGETYDYDKKKKDGLPIGAIIGIVVGIAVFLGVFFGVIRKRNKNKSEKQNDSDGGEK